MISKRNICYNIAQDNNWYWYPRHFRLRFLRYDKGEYFAPHFDGQYRRENGERSYITVQVYLNEVSRSHVGWDCDKRGWTPSLAHISTSFIKYPNALSIIIYFLILLVFFMFISFFNFFFFTSLGLGFPYWGPLHSMVSEWTLSKRFRIRTYYVYIDTK